MHSTQTIKLTKTKEIAFTAILTFLAVYAPAIIHYFGGVDGGRKLLPMPFIVLAAGLILGWRAGLVTGLMSVLVSYFVSGMPMLNVLPIILLQITALGFVAGIAKIKYSFWLATLLAIFASWIAMAAAVYFFSHMPVTKFVVSSISDGRIGILLQIAILPLIAAWVSRHFAHENEV